MNKVLESVKSAGSFQAFVMLFAIFFAVVVVMAVWNHAILLGLGGYKTSSSLRNSVTPFLASELPCVVEPSVFGAGKDFEILDTVVGP
jgi:hypothetical protein